MRRRGRVARAVGATAVAGITAMALMTPSGAGAAVASATLVDINGREVGDALFRYDRGGALRATVRVAIDQSVTANPAEFHGLHLHAGSPAGCVTYSPGNEPQPSLRFTEIGPHWAQPGQAHGAHTGDLPSLLRNTDGTATVELLLDKLAVDDIVGRALVVHHLADDFGKHPGVGTSSTAGNAGPRYACGVIESAASR